MYQKIIFTTFVAFAIFFWSIITPLFEFPDEQAHLESVEFLVKNSRMPVGEEKDMSKEMYETQKYLGLLRNNLGVNQVTYHPEYRVNYSDSLSGIHEESIKSLNTETYRSTYVAKEAARYPRLYYQYIGTWHRAFDAVNIIDRTYILRFGGLVISILMIIATYRLGNILFNNQLYAQILTLLVMLQPMHSFLLAGINSDNLHNLLLTCILCIGIYHLGYKPTRISVLSTIILLVLDILTKPQGFIAIPLVIIPFIPQLKKVKLTQTILFIVILYMLVGIVYLYPYYSPYMSLISNSTNVNNTSLLSFIQFSLDKLIHQNIVWYWGVFKWLGVVLPPIYWQLANRLVLVAGLGLIVYLINIYKKHNVIVKPSYFWYLLFASVYYATMIYWFDWNHVKNVGYSLGVQARYLFPTITAHMSLLMIGLLSFTNNPKIQTWILRGLGLFIIWMQIGGIWRLITSYYGTSSLQLFITQASQYKPAFAKGEWWYLWISLYVLSLLYLAYLVLKPQKISTTEKA